MALDTENLEALRIDKSERGAGGNRGVWLGAVAALVALAAVAWFALSNGTSATEVVLAEARALDAGAADDAVLNASGYVTARRLATVSSLVTGKIREVLVEEGMEVERDQPLAYLDDALAKARHNLALSQLQAARDGLAETDVRLAEAELSLDRTRRLREAKLTSEAALDTASAEVNALRARLVSARGAVDVAERAADVTRQDLDELVIRAPFAGVVISKNAQPGEMISPVSAGGGFTRTGICTIVDMASLEIEVDVNEAYINRVSPDQPVVARLDAYPNDDIGASVINIVPAADRQKATVRVRIAFDALDARMLPDMGVRVRFLDDAVPAANDAPTAVSMIAASAVEIDGQQPIVWVVSGGAVQRRAIATGARRGSELEVLAGLRPGERVVDRPAGGFEDGQRVAIGGARE
ncbi:MAG: efflux RND transporter periplasmic adaptor subunit [Pseudomonadota bacterium]